MSQKQSKKSNTDLVLEFTNFLKFKKGLKIGGVSPDNNLVEMIEIPDHPFFIASQFHPEFKSRPWDPAPLFKEFVLASIKNISIKSENIVSETIKEK